jgi:hypothetical protein
LDRSKVRAEDGQQFAKPFSLFFRLRDWPIRPPTPSSIRPGWPVFGQRLEAEQLAQAPIELSLAESGPRSAGDHHEVERPVKFSATMPKPLSDPALKAIANDRIAHLATRRNSESTSRIRLQNAVSNTDFPRWSHEQDHVAM